MHPVPAREDARIKRLHELGILFSEPSEPFDRICELVAAQFDVPIAFVSFVDTSVQWFKARIGIELTATPREVAFCAHTIMSDDVLVVEDTLADPRFTDNPLVQGEPRIRFYAGAPIIMPSGLRLGSVCAADRRPRRLSEAERQLLANYAGLVVSQLQLQQAARLLRQNVAERARLEMKIESLAHARHSEGVSSATIAGCDVPLPHNPAAASPARVQP